MEPQPYSEVFFFKLDKAWWLRRDVRQTLPQKVNGQGQEARLAGRTDC